MKKYLIFLFIVVFCFISTLNIFASSSGNINSTNNQIKYLAYPWFALNEELLVQFTEETNIKIVQEVLSYEDLNTRIITSSMAGKKPADVFTAYVVPLASHVSANFIENLGNYVSKELQDDLLGLEVFKFDKKLMGIPLNYDITVMHYNKKILKDANISHIPETLQELYKTCELLRNKGILKYPFTIPLAAHPGTSSKWYLLSLSFGGTLFDDNYNSLFLEPNSSGYKALKFMIDSYGKIIDPALIDIIDVELMDTYLSGNWGFAFGSIGSYQISENPEKSDIAGQTGIALIPGSEDVKSAALNFYLDGLAISRLSDNKKAAWQFIEWLLKPEISYALYINNGILPSRKSVLFQLIESNKIFGGAYIIEQSKYAKTIFPGGIPYWFEEWELEVANQINQAVRGNIKIEEALDNIAKKAKQLKD